MNGARTILTLMLCVVCSVYGDSVIKVGVVYVGGDVPKPGPVKFKEEGMTIDSVMAGVGMDISPFYAKENGDNDGLRCPIKVLVFSKGEKTIYDPSVYSATMLELSLELKDSIEVTDFRKHPEKIAARKQRTEKMLELGSTEIIDELLSLAALQYEYDEWRGQDGAATKGSVKYLKKEIARLVGEGKGQRILDILELKLGALQLQGLGHAHPAVKSTTDLIEILRDLVPK